jgi:uncharacterized protein YfiM (DUF2279 family)
MRTPAVFRAALALSLMLAGQACRAEDDWLGGDKRAHFLGGLVIGGVFSFATGSKNPGVLMGCGVGAVGELIEVVRYGVFSPHVSAKDFAAECAGGIAGAYIGVWAAPSSRVDSANAKAANDSWTGADKRGHFLGGLLVSGLVANYTDSATVGLISGCAVTTTGELIDAAHHGWHSKHTSAKDALVGCLGAVAGAFASVQISPNRIVWSEQF